MIRRKTYVFAILVIVIVLLQSSCAGSAPVPPTHTAVVNTFTPENTATPTATFTPTLTPSPTATSTPAGTPTQIPEVIPPADGTGNVVGLVLWNNEPVKKTAVWLCEDWAQSWSGGTCVGKQSATTDKNGYYVFKNIKPGAYIVSINSFGSSWFIFYFDQGNKMQTVAAGETLILNPWNIWKYNLRMTAPTNNKRGLERQPTFKWESYPGAAYYLVSIYEENPPYNWVIKDEKVLETEYKPAVPLTSGKYSWRVEAYNEQGMIIAHGIPTVTMRDWSDFEVIAAP